MVTGRTVLLAVGFLATVAVVLPAVSTGIAGTGDAASGPVDRIDGTVAATLQADGVGGSDSIGPTAGDTDDTDENRAAFGLHLTAFMQDNAAQVDATVDNEMWEAAFDVANDSRRTRLTEGRVAVLADRIVTLTERRRSLAARYRNDTLSSQAYVAAVSRLDGRTEGIEISVNDTVTAADRIGLNVTVLEPLRTSVRNLTDPGVYGIEPHVLAVDGESLVTIPAPDSDDRELPAGDIPVGTDVLPDLSEGGGTTNATGGESIGVGNATIGDDGISVDGDDGTVDGGNGSVDVPTSTLAPEFGGTGTGVTGNTST